MVTIVAKKKILKCFAKFVSLLTVAIPWLYLTTVANLPQMQP